MLDLQIVMRISNQYKCRIEIRSTTHSLMLSPNIQFIKKLLKFCVSSIRGVIMPEQSGAVIRKNHLLLLKLTVTYAG